MKQEPIFYFLGDFGDDALKEELDEELEDALLIFHVIISVNDLNLEAKR